MHVRFLTFTILLGTLAVLPGCGRTKVVSTAPTSGGGSMTINFDHLVSGLPLVVNGTSYFGTDGAGNDFSVTTLRYLISDLQLHSGSGLTYGMDRYIYRDASLASTRQYTLNGVPPGLYQRLSFTFGLEERFNGQHDAIAHDPNVIGMEWPANWGGGWSYMILQGLYAPASGGIPYQIRTGRRFIAASGDPSGEGPDTTAYPHYFNVTLTFPTPVTIAGDSWETTVRMELNGWYDNPNLSLADLFPTGTESIMLNLSAQDLLEQNGPNCFSITTAAHH